MRRVNIDASSSTTPVLLAAPLLVVVLVLVAVFAIFGLALANGFLKKLEFIDVLSVEIIVGSLGLNSLAVSRSRSSVEHDDEDTAW